MKKFLFLLITLISFTATAQSTVTSVEAEVTHGQKGYRNYVTNPTCKRNVAAITASDAVAVKNTTTALDGISDCKWNPTATAQTLTWAVKSFSKGIVGGNCEARINYLGDASLVKSYVKQGSTKVTAADVQLTNSGTNSATASLSYPCGDNSSATTVVLESTGDAANNQYAIYAGENTNVGTVAQAIVAGESYFSGMTSMIDAFTASTTVPVNYATAADIPGPTVLFSTLGTWATTDNNTYMQTITNLPPGVYEAEFTGNYYEASGSGNCSHGVSDGTTAGGWHYPTVTGAGSAGPMTFKNTFVYTTAQATVSFRPQVLACGSSSVNWYPGSTVSRVMFRLKYSPSQSQQAVRMDQSNFDWVDGGVTSITATTSNPTKPSGIAIDKYWYRRRGSVLDVRVEFAATNTTSAAAGSGDYLFNVIPSGLAIDTTKLTAYATVEGSGQFSNRNAVGSGSMGSATNSGAVTVSVYNSTSVRLLAIYDANGGAVSSGLFHLAETPHYTFYFSVPIVGWTENQNAPLLVGGVTNSSSGLTRVEAATIANNGTATATQVGDWITSVTRNSAGHVTMVIKSGIFSATPVCVCNALNNTGVSAYHCAIASDVTKSNVLYGFETINGSTVLTDREFNVTCVGPR